MDQGLTMRGVVGVMGGELSSRGRDLILQRVLRLGLGGIEIRADLFKDPREALECLRGVKGLAPVLFTIRNSLEGGSFRGEERDRIAFFEEALAAGASLIDAEWGTEAARALSMAGAPLLLSHHDFQGTPGLKELSRIAKEMEGVPCQAVKIVPTACRLSDALAILRWIEERDPRGPARVAFAMGEAGFPSRMLAISRGSPISYGSLGKPVAPGQITAEEMLCIYRPERRTPATRVLAVIGQPSGRSFSPHAQNPALISRGIDAVFLPFLIERFEEIVEALDPLGIDGLRVEGPYKEEALRRSDGADSRSRLVGGADALKIERGVEGKTSIRAFNTEFEGILEPLRRRKLFLRSLKAAVIGEGTAARRAALALREAGASPTIYYQNMTGDVPASRGPGIPGRPVSALRPGDAGLILNTSSSGREPGGPSPVPATIFDRSTIAFETCCDPEETVFLKEAASAGATCIPGMEMFVSQAVEEFRIFTGQVVDREEIEANFKKGVELRHTGT